MYSDIGSMRVAQMVEGKTVQEIRELFDVVNDFTPQEEVSFEYFCRP